MKVVRKKKRGRPEKPKVAYVKSGGTQVKPKTIQRVVVDKKKKK